MEPEGAPSDASFCSQCGSSVDGAALCLHCDTGNVRESLYCGKCGAELLDAQVSFCPECGAPCGDEADTRDNGQKEVLSKGLPPLPTKPVEGQAAPKRKPLPKPVKKRQLPERGKKLPPVPQQKVVYPPKTISFNSKNTRKGMPAVPSNPKPVRPKVLQKALPNPPGDVQDEGNKQAAGQKPSPLETAQPAFPGIADQKPVLPRAPKPAAPKGPKPAVPEVASRRPALPETPKRETPETAKPSVLEAASPKPALPDLPKPDIPKTAKPPVPGVVSRSKPLLPNSSKPALPKARKPALPGVPDLSSRPALPETPKRETPKTAKPSVLEAASPKPALPDPPKSAAGQRVPEGSTEDQKPPSASSPRRKPEVVGEPTPPTGKPTLPETPKPAVPGEIPNKPTAPGVPEFSAEVAPKKQDLIKPEGGDSLVQENSADHQEVITSEGEMGEADQSGYEAGAYEGTGYEEAGYEETGYEEEGYEEVGYEEDGYEGEYDDSSHEEGKGTQKSESKTGKAPKPATLTFGMEEIAKARSPSMSKEDSFKKNEDIKEDDCPFTAQALFDFTAEKDIEVSFKEKEKFTVMETDMNNIWWRAQFLDGRQGWFPKDYVSAVAEGAYQKKPNVKWVKRPDGSAKGGMAYVCVSDERTGNAALAKKGKKKGRSRRSVSPNPKKKPLSTRGPKLKRALSNRSVKATLAKESATGTGKEDLSPRQLGSQQVEQVSAPKVDPTTVSKRKKFTRTISRKAGHFGNIISRSKDEDIEIGLPSNFKHVKSGADDATAYHKGSPSRPAAVPGGGTVSFGEEVSNAKDSDQTSPVVSPRPQLPLSRSSENRKYNGASGSSESARGNSIAPGPRESGRSSNTSHKRSNSWNQNAGKQLTTEVRSVPLNAGKSPRGQEKKSSSARYNKPLVHRQKSTQEDFKTAAKSKESLYFAEVKAQAAQAPKPVRRNPIIRDPVALPPGQIIKISLLKTEVINVAGKSQRVYVIGVQWVNMCWVIKRQMHQLHELDSRLRKCGAKYLPKAKLPSKTLAMEDKAAVKNRFQKLKGYLRALEKKQMLYLQSKKTASPFQRFFAPIQMGDIKDPGLELPFEIV